MWKSSKVQKKTTSALLQVERKDKIFDLVHYVRKVRFWHAYQHSATHCGKRRIFGVFPIFVSMKNCIFTDDRNRLGFLGFWIFGQQKLNFSSVCVDSNLNQE